MSNGILDDRPYYLAAIRGIHNLATALTKLNGENRLVITAYITLMDQYMNDTNHLLQDQVDELKAKILLANIPSRVAAAVANHLVYIAGCAKLVDDVTLNQQIKVLFKKSISRSDQIVKQFAKFDFNIDNFIALQNLVNNLTVT